MNRLVLVLIIGLFACNSVTDKSKSASGKLISKDNLALTESQNVATTDQIPRENCARGKAEPIIKKTVYPKTTFVLQPDSLSGIETVNFENGDKLTIKNWGCEYYVLTFSFETSRFQQDTTDLKYWFKTATGLVTEIFDGVDSPIDIKKGITQLTNHIDSDKNLKLGDEIDFGGDEIREFVSVDRIKKLIDKKYAVEISFATGPL